MANQTLRYDFFGLRTKQNQKVFSEIRNFMDDVNKGYDNRKKRTEQIKKIQEAYIEKMKN